MKEFAVIVTDDNGSKWVNGYYKYAKTAINEAKKCNECKYLHYKYKVMNVCTKETIYE